MVAVFLIVGIIFVVFVNSLIGGVMILLLIWGLTIRFLAREANKGGAKRKKDDS